MPSIRGKATKLYIGDQANIQTRTPADSYQNTYMYSIRPGGGRAFENDPILGGDFFNDRDATQPAPGLSESSVSIAGPSCMNHLAYWLRAAMGDPVVSGTAPVLRTYQSGKDTLPSHTLAYNFSPTDGRRISGFVLGSIAFNIARQAGFGRVQIDGAARKFEPLADIDVGTVPAAHPLTRAPAYRGIFRVDTVAEATLLSTTATYNNNLDLVEYANDDEFIGDICPGDADFKSQINIRYKDRWFADKSAEAFQASGLFACEYEWQNGSGQSLIIKAPKCRVAQSSEEISGPGGIEVGYNIVAEQDAAAAMLSVELRNTIADGGFL